MIAMKGKFVSLKFGINSVQNSLHFLYQHIVNTIDFYQSNSINNFTLQKVEKKLHLTWH